MTISEKKSRIMDFITRTLTTLRSVVRVYAIANPSLVCLLSLTFVQPTEGLKLSAQFLPRCVP